MADHRDGSISRRDFVGRAIAGTFAAAGCLPVIGAEAQAPKQVKRSAFDQVKLGPKVIATRLAMGTGSDGGSVQRAMGQDSFTRMVRHAYDRGLRFIDTADPYKTHEMVREAIRGLPREKLTIQTKLPWGGNPDVAKELDRFRKELGTEYIDIVLLHNTSPAGWPEKLEKLRDGLSAAKEKGIVRAVGVSVHGLPGLREVARCKWVEVALLRLNHKGHHMDGDKGEWAEPGRLEDALAEIRKIAEAGKSVIGMKLIGNGDFKDAEEREKSIRFVLSKPFITAVDMGFKSPAEVDEAIERIDRALNAG
jgi:1-deoxyxylulose-5-phosphate synthase